MCGSILHLPHTSTLFGVITGKTLHFKYYLLVSSLILDCNFILNTGPNFENYISRWQKTRNHQRNFMAMRGCT